MPTCCIIDDELNARELLKIFLREYGPDWQLIGEADSVQTGQALLMSQTPDLLFLDVEMQDGTGFDLLDRIQNIPGRVVFVTSFERFALRAFQYNAIDFLVKPIDPELFCKTLDRCCKEQRGYQPGQLEQLRDSYRTKKLQKIALPSQEGITMVDLKAICFLQSDGNYSWVHLLDEERFLVTRSMKDFERMLAADRFFRVHQQYLVNLLEIKKVLRTDGGQLLMENGAILPIARRRKEELIKRLEELE